MEKMNKVWICCVQALAITDAICFLLLVAPSVFYKLGIDVHKWLGQDGSSLISFSILVFIITCTLFISFANPTFMKTIIPNQKTIVNFYIPYSILTGYVIWGVSILYPLSRYL